MQGLRQHSQVVGMTPSQQANVVASQAADGVHEFSEEDIQAAEAERMRSLYEAISSERDEWVEYRANNGKENEWRRADKLYDGVEVGDDGSDGLEDTLRNGPSQKRGGKNKAKRSRVRINIVAPAVDNQVARMCEILLPVDDKNWGIRPTPNAAVSDLISDQRPVIDPTTQQSVGTVAGIAKSVQDTALGASKNMEREIDDQLTEARFNGETRKMMFSAGKLGTGIMKGPFVVRVEERKWVTKAQQDGSRAAVMEVTEKFVPNSRCISIWNVFPDPACGDDVQRGKGLWEKKDLTRKELRALARRPGYDPEAIRTVLKQKPMIVKVNDGKVDKDDSKYDLYQVWEYHGEVEPEDFQAVADRSNKAEGSEDVDQLECYAGCLIVVNDMVIGALPMMTADNSLPYDFFQWKKDDDSPFGSGIPVSKETQQRVVNSAWRQTMDNAGNTSGPQFVIKKTAISPEDGIYEIVANKIWLANDELDDVSKAFAAIQIDSRITELLKIVDAAMLFGDQESGTSPMMAGEKSQPGETLGGQTMRWTNANGVHRMRVKLFDDAVTRPHLTRYYDWNMQNNDKEEIKGDFEVDARGSSTLIERDIQNQAMVNVAAMFQNPIFAPMLKPLDALRATLKSWKLDPADFMKTDEEIKQAQDAASQAPPQQDPQIAAKLQLTQMTLADKQAQRVHEEHMEGTHDQNRQHQIDVQQENQNARLREADRTNDVKLQIATMNLQGRAAAQQEVAAQRSADHRLAIDSKHQLFNAEAAIKATEGSGL